MSRYEKYKDSGIAWIGEIPEGWELKRMKNVCSGFSNGTSVEQLATEITQCKVTRIETISNGLINYNKVGFVTNSRELEKFKLKINDILISNINSFRMVGNCAMFEGVEDLYHGMNLIRITPLGNIKPKFLLNYLKTGLFTCQMQSACKPAINQVSVPSSVIKQMIVVYPSIAEQEAIAEFLDGKCEEVDRLVGLQQAMIEELVAYKQSVITECVTKGLDPSAPLRDSGIPWIGSIPAHWEVKNIKYIFKLLNHLRQPISAENRERNNPLYDYYGASGVIDKIDHYNVDDKVLLIGEDGANLLFRNLPLIYKAEGKFWVNNHAHILKPKVDNYNYLAHIMESADYRLFITGSAQPKLSQENLNKIRICLPPLQEQQAIADHLDRKCEEIDNLISIKREKIEQLKEYKKSIIFEYVTGKKRVMN